MLSKKPAQHDEAVVARRRPPQAATPEIAPPEATLLANGLIQRARSAPQSLTPGEVLQLQRRVGNRAVIRHITGLAAPPLQHAPANVIQRGRTKHTAKKAKSPPVPKLPKASLTKTKRKKKASKAGLARAIKARQEEMAWDFATGHKSSGQWTEEVTVRSAYSFDAERVRQILRHISTAVFYDAKARVDEEQEVQALYVNDRLLLSSNLPGSMAELKGLTSEQAFNLFLSYENLPASDKRARGDVNKLRALLGGSRIGDIAASEAETAELRQLADMVRSAIQDPSTYLPHCALSDAASRIKDDAYRNKIIIVEGTTPVHAEQNLILAYYKSGTSARGLIYGKKRPCTGCYMTFVYATEVLKLNLVYNQHPGGFWGPAVAGLWQLLCQAKVSLEDVEKFVDEHLPEMTFRTQSARAAEGDKKKPRTDLKAQETGYDSASDSDIGDVEYDLKHLGK